MCGGTFPCRAQGEEWAEPVEPGLPVSAYLSLQLACLPMRNQHCTECEEITVVRVIKATL